MTAFVVLPSPTISAPTVLSPGVFVILNNDGPAGPTGPAGDSGHIVPVTWVLDEGGAAITTGEKAVVEIPFGCTIIGWSLLADAGVGDSVSFDIWKCPRGSYPPTIADSIVGTIAPSLSGVNVAGSSDLTGWTTYVAADDVLMAVCATASGVTSVTLTLKVQKT